MFAEARLWLFLSSFVLIQASLTRPYENKKPAVNSGYNLLLRREGDYLSMIPGERASNQSYQTLSGFFLFTHRLRIAGILKLFAKIKNPSARDLIRLVWRREGDSNPRYSYPYGSLANCWFKPLTHLSIIFRTCPPKALTRLMGLPSGLYITHDRSATKIDKQPISSK